MSETQGVKSEAAPNQQGKLSRVVDPATATAEDMLEIPAFRKLLSERQPNKFEPHNAESANSRLRARIDAVEDLLATL